MRSKPSIVFYLLPVIFFNFTGHCQQAVRFYEGGINNTKVSMTLNFMDTLVFGSYYYKRSGQRIILNGQIKNNAVDLTASVPDGTDAVGISDKFSGRVDHSHFWGVWTAKDKSFNFDFKQIRKNIDWIFSSAEVSLDCTHPSKERQDNSCVFQYILPVGKSNPVLADSIISNVLGKEYLGLDTVTDALDEYVTDHIKYLIGRGESPEWWQEEYFTGEVCFLAGKLLTYKVRIFDYHTGSHANIYTKYFVFDTLTGSRLYLSDIFEKDKIDSVYAVVTSSTK